ncbi:hypothetical protein E4T44_10920 [Aureobasidium sp. EXF-8845]|nr:hypothetical protein E4T45_12256 [Aureobasidium sp. EXF-8846]KAI4810494.1 hypothetical protein E4T44_10920 [Aureobasidium sp. EXF-8845]
MASFLKEKITGSQSDVDSASADKYFIQVNAGTSYEDPKAKQVIINGAPTQLNKNAKVAVRIKEYQGLPLGSPATSPYFDDHAHSNDTYSIAVSWIPEEDIDADDLVWGIELINPIRDRIPGRFITTAFNIVKRFVDSSLQCDPDADQPWVNGPILCSSAITFSIGSKGTCELPAILSEGSLSDDSAMRKSHDIPTSDSQRRKHFLDEHRRKEFIFEKGRCYAFDFHNGYIDWKNYALKLPGFSFGVLKYINDRTHTTRFVLKSRKTGKVFVATTFRLLYGEELEKAKKKSAAAAAQTGETGEAQPQYSNTAEVQRKEPLQKGSQGNSNGDREILEQLKGPEADKVDPNDLLRQPVQGPQVEMADRTRVEQQPLQEPVKLNGMGSQESDRSKSLPNGGSEVHSQYEEEHPAGNAVEQVIAASEERRMSEQHRRSVDGNI